MKDDEQRSATGRRKGKPPVAERLLTVTDVAETLQISPRTVRRMIAKGQLRIIRLGRSVRIHATALSELLDNQGQE
jgi:excisionase family DNA binding protein